MCLSGLSICMIYIPVSYTVRLLSHFFLLLLLLVFNGHVVKQIRLSKSRLTISVSVCLRSLPTNAADLAVISCNLFIIDTADSVE